MTEDEAYMNLQAAIIERAVEDYRVALINERLREARQIERFFRSELGQALTMNNGEEIIKRVRKEVENDGDNQSRRYFCITK